MKKSIFFLVLLVFVTNTVLKGSDLADNLIFGGFIPINRLKFYCVKNGEVIDMFCDDYKLHQLGEDGVRTLLSNKFFNGKNKNQIRIIDKSGCENNQFRSIITDIREIEGGMVLEVCLTDPYEKCLISE